jgi:hypothetical protein
MNCSIVSKSDDEINRRKLIESNLLSTLIARTPQEAALIGVLCGFRYIDSQNE